MGDATPKIHPTAFISEFAYVIGRCRNRRRGSSVWPGAVVRADMGKIVIGKHTNIQDNSAVHGDADVEIGDYVTIGHKVLCHAKTVGNRAVIGNGATLNDGVEIGEYSLIASGTMLVDDVKIPPRSLVVGSPGKVLREVGEASSHQDEMVLRRVHGKDGKVQGAGKPGVSQCQSLPT